METSGFVDPKYIPVAMAGTGYAVLNIVFNLLGFEYLDWFHVIKFVQVYLPVALCWRPTVHSKIVQICVQLSISNVTTTR